MADTDLLYFSELKKFVQKVYLEKNHPLHEDISKWKGIDIIYFQEDLRKRAKGNISEKSFYTYFKNPKLEKLPRLDMLNLLAVYAGFDSWAAFKKVHTPEDSPQTNESKDLEIREAANETTVISAAEIELQIIDHDQSSEEIKAEVTKPPADHLQKTTSVNQEVNENIDVKKAEKVVPSSQPKIHAKSRRRELFLLLGLIILAVFSGVTIFWDQIFAKKFYYSFVDADRNSKINAELHVEILKENESPILYTAKANEPFVYTTKSKKLTMVVSSPYYRTDTIRRNLENAPEAETFQLKPNDYAIMLYYYSKSPNDLKQKRERLNFIISDRALIYQVYDSDEYGIETMDKQRYISLVTIPTKSLDHLEVIETKTDAGGKINMIKFRINDNEAAQ